MMVDRTVHTISRYLLLVALLLLLVLQVNAAPDSYRIDLPARSFTPPIDHGQWLQSKVITGQGETVLLQFDRHPDEATKHALATRGFELQFYVGGGAWVAWVDADADPQQLSAFSPRWVGPLLPSDRLNPILKSSEVPGWADAGDGTRLYAVRFTNNTRVDESEAELWKWAAEVGAYVEPFRTWYIRMAPDQLDALSEVPNVLWIDYIAPPLENLNASVRATMFVDEAQAHPYDLTGEGVTVCVYDGGIVDYTHPDFGGRASAGEGGGFADHPTHVAGTVGGAGDDNVRGMAPRVSILSYAYEECEPFCLYNSPQDIWSNYGDAVINGGARIITNSIGANVGINSYPCSWLGDYELTSALVDSAVRGGLGEEVVVLFSAGNERQSGAPCGDWQSVSIPAGAKNVITVGATNDVDAVAPFSSLGPTDDGRIKPEVVGNGVDVLSTAPGGSYQTMSGTSMSTPAVAGVTALLMEAWDRLPGLERPIPAQIKALLVTGADDEGNFGPDYRYGFGRVNAVQTVDIINRYGFTRGEVEDEGQWTLEFAVEPDVANLKVSLAWADPPAAPLAIRTLVNDLDLTLISPSNSTFYPFILDGTNPNSPVEYGRNEVDVVEQVFVLTPEPGTWRIVVDGYDIPFGPQSFGIAATVPLQSDVVRVEGIVTDAETGVPVEGAVISGLDAIGGARSGTEGDYVAWMRLTDDTQLLCSAPNYQTQSGFVLAGSAEPVLTRNFALTATGTVLVEGTVRDENGNTIAGVEVLNQENPSNSSVSDENGLFSFTLPLGQFYHFTAQQEGLAGHAEYYLPSYGEIPPLEITLLNQAPLPTGPDAHGYIAIQGGDNHPLAPTYDWIEIDPDQGGNGTRIATSEEETPYAIELPFDFTYYGVTYDSISINENGFFFFGDFGNMANAVAGDFSNSEIPALDGPPAMVAPFWEDFRANDTFISIWHDEANGLCVIEWHDSRQYPTDGTRETFQVILYDTTLHPTPSGDGWIKFQYADVNDLANATVGIESPDERDGLELLYFDADGNGSYSPTIGEIVDESAILFVRSLTSISGVVTLIPDTDDVDVRVWFGEQETICDTEGNFTLGSLSPVVDLLEVRADGYEAVTVGIDLTNGEPAENNITLWGLLPPINLTGEDTESGYQLTWDPPSHPGGPATSFLDRYHVFRDGEQLLETDEASWLDPGPYVEETRYWVTALYAGGESDTSAHVSPGSVSSVNNGVLPSQFEVSSAWPNPFNPATSLRVALPQASNLRVEIVDILGRQVDVLTDRKQVQAGNHRLTWNATGHASGLYFVRVQAGHHHAVRKVMLLK